MNIEMGNFLDKYAVRTYRQVLIHSIVTLVLFVLLYFTLGERISIATVSFVAIMSSMAAACGALLAVSLALAMFFSRHIIDWRDRLIEALRESLTLLGAQMGKSAQRYPEISRRLVELYLKAAFYIPGQPIDRDDVFEASKVFDDWAKDEALKSKRKFDFGDLKTYDSFEKHLFDASLCSTNVRENLLLLSVTETAGRSIPSFAPLIMVWAIILVFSLVFSIVGGMGLVSENNNLAFLIIPLYLFIVAIFALIKDVTAIIPSMRMLETGYEQAMLELVSKSESNSKT